MPALRSYCSATFHSYNRTSFYVRITNQIFLIQYQNRILCESKLFSKLFFLLPLFLKSHSEIHVISLLSLIVTDLLNLTHVMLLFFFHWADS